MSIEKLKSVNIDDLQIENIILSAVFCIPKLPNDSQKPLHFSAVLFFYFSMPYV